MVSIFLLLYNLIRFLSKTLKTVLRELTTISCPVGWGCRIHWLHLCGGVRPPPNQYPDYDTKHSAGEVLVMMEPWEIRSIHSLPLLPGRLWPGVVALDRAKGIFKVLCSNSSSVRLFSFLHPVGYQSAQFFRRALHYASGSRKSFARVLNPIYIYIYIYNVQWVLRC